MSEHALEVRAVRPTTMKVVLVPPYIDLVVGHTTLGFYLGCTGCEAADPTTHKTRDRARRSTWRHP